VSTDGCIDWFCCPRFDSPSVFASLLDADKGGHCRIRPVISLVPGTAR
jgi:GH15 family glucan-1,4-alpha-glucosidase